MYLEDIEIKDARLFFTNFSGRERQYNPKGNRNFCVEIPEDLVPRLREEGWNIKHYENEERGVTYDYIQVTVRYNNIPPIIIMTCDDGDNKIRMTESMVGFLDEIDVSRFDVKIHPRKWERGVKAYLKRMKVVVPSEEFEYCVD